MKPVRRVGDLGEVAYLLDGKLHREDGPAVEYPNGDQEWWLNGNRHREDGPAIQDEQGNKTWYQNNLLHRENGPAVEFADGKKEWWIAGRKLIGTEANTEALHFFTSQPICDRESYKNAIKNCFQQYD